MSPKLKDIAKEMNVPANELTQRLDGRIEWICEHGVGHTVWFPENSDSIHGCCGHGCCSKF